MEIQFQQVADLYLEKERLRAYHEIEVKKRAVIEEFGDYLESLNGEEWYVRDITGKEAKDFVKLLESKEEEEGEVLTKLKELYEFLGFMIEFRKTGVLFIPMS